MRARKIILSVLLTFATPVAAFCQSEVLKGVVNSLARYQDKKEFKHLAAAKKSIDSLLTINADSTNFEKNLYLTVINSTVLYTDSLNSLKQPDNLLARTTRLLDKLCAENKNAEFEDDLLFAANCLANVHIRSGFNLLAKSDLINAQRQFLAAKKLVPGFMQLDSYLAFVNTRLGNLATAVAFYDNLRNEEKLLAEQVESASTVYKTVGDTLKAIKLLQHFRKISPDNVFLLLDEANIYNNKRDYASLEPLLPYLLENNGNNPDIVFVAANCYDRLGKYDEAERLYHKAIELNSSAYDPAFNLGLLYFKKGEGQNADNNLAYAAKWLEKANEIAPYNVNCLEVLSLLHRQTGNIIQLDKVNSKLKQLTN